MTYAPAAVLFDLDGTLMNTKGMSGQAQIKVLQALVGAQVFDKTFFKEEIRPKARNLGDFGAAKYFCEAYGINEPVELVDKMITDATKAVVEKMDASRVRRGTREILDLISTKKLPKALITNSFKTFTYLALEKANILHEFDVVVTGGDVKNGKPDPEGYLLAAQQLGQDPRKCLIFEDSVPGVRAALATGAKVIAVTDDVEAMQKAVPEINLIVPSLLNISWETITNLT